MKLVRLEQGSLPWIEWRRGGLGGSDVAALLGLSPFEDATPEHLFREKVFGERKEGSFAMRRGTRLEPVARTAFERLVSRSYEPVCVEHADQPWIRASLDGLAFKPAEILEIKAPNWRVHDWALSGIVPDYYAVQCQWQLLATGFDVCHFVSINDGKRFAKHHQLAHVELRADGEEQARLLEAAEAFWARVVAARREAVAA